MLQLLVNEASLLEAQTNKSEELVDIDGLNDKYLPSTTWAAGISNLQTEIDAIKTIEQSIRQQYSSIDLVKSINSLKPLLSAPLVVNFASFREELNAAVAEVKRAESNFHAKQHESFSARLEVTAQDLLNQVF